MLKDPARTFFWIVSVLRLRNVPFVVSGGLAAKSYGSARALNDIDIDIRNEDFPKILNDIKPYVIFGPDRYRDAKWDLLLSTLNHHGQEIDLGGGSDIRIYDSINKQWVSTPVDFSDAEQRDVFGLTVPVVSPATLVAYKSLLDGDHQQSDIQAVASFLGKRAE